MLQVLNTGTWTGGPKVQRTEKVGMPATVTQMHKAVRSPETEGVVFAVPHLEVMTVVESA